MPRHLLASVCICLIAFASLSADDAAPAKEGPFVLRNIVTTKSFYVFKLNVATGALYYENQTDHKWVKAGDAGELPAGAYDVVHHDTGEALYLFRIDRTSGKSWFLAGDKMQEIPEIDADKAPKGTGFVFDIKGHETTKTAFWFYRIDPRTGAAWKMAALKWQAVAE